MISIDKDIFAKIARIAELSKQDFQKIFEEFLEREVTKLENEAQASVPASAILLLEAKNFKYSNPQSSEIDGKDTVSYRLPPYLEKPQSWIHIFYIFLCKLPRCHKTEAIIQYLQKLGVTVSYGQNKSRETRKTCGGWTYYNDLGISVRLSGGEAFFPVIQKIAEKEKIPFSVTVTWEARAPQKYKGKKGRYSYPP